MKPLDDDTLRAIADLHGNPNFEKIRKWIRESRKEAIKAGGGDFNFGRAAEIQDMEDAIDSAREKYEDIEKLKKNPQVGVDIGI